MNNFSFSLIVSHGFLDIFKFKHKIETTCVYIIFSLLFGVFSFVFPSALLIFMIYNTNIHFGRDLQYFYKKELNFAPTIFISTLIRNEHYLFWDNTLDNLTYGYLEKYLVISYVILAGIYYSCDLIKNRYYITLLLSAIYGYYTGPYYSVYIYMIYHSGLTYTKCLICDINKPINSEFNENFHYLILYILTIGFITYSFSDLLIMSLNYSILRSFIFGVLNVHLLLHNYKFLDDNNRL